MNIRENRVRTGLKFGYPDGYFRSQYPLSYPMPSSATAGLDLEIEKNAAKETKSGMPKVKNNLGFKEWMQQESGTTSSSIATFSMPLGSIVRRKFPNEKKKKNKNLLEYYQHFDSNDVIKLIRSNIISLNANPSTKTKNALIKNLMKLIHSNEKLHNKFLIPNNQEEFYLIDILEKFTRYTNKINAKELSKKELFRIIIRYLSKIKENQIKDNIKKQKKMRSGADEEHGPGSYSINQASYHPFTPYLATVNPRLQIRYHRNVEDEEKEKENDFYDSNEAIALRFLTKLLKNYSKLNPLFGMVFCLLYNIDYENISFNSIRNMRKLKTTAGNGIYKQIFINISKDPKKIKIYSDYLKSLNYKISELNSRSIETQLNSIANKAKKFIKAAIQNSDLYENSKLLKIVIAKIGK